MRRDGSTPDDWMEPHQYKAVLRRWARQFSLDCRYEDASTADALAEIVDEWASARELVS